MTGSARRSGFTMVETVTVISIIAIVAAITYPVVIKVKRSGRTAQTIQNMRSLQVGAILYQADYAGTLAGTPEAMGLPPMFGTVRPFPGSQAYLAAWYKEMKSPFGDKGRDYNTFAIPSAVDRLPVPWAECTQSVGERCILYWDPFEPGRDPVSGAWVSTEDLDRKRLHGVALAGNLVTHEDIGSPHDQAWWIPDLRSR
ncbi:MAG TPA: prepilin-type N-terminal cleavage/methylation domain-containing protein [Fimbriimonadaceae bacterium]|nr:prepilin-type N-terminal cleavage/methylation domain-containing protein [Fimbriimonadaceae bacterium]